MLNGIFASLYGTSITLPAFLAASALSLVLGLGISWVYGKTADSSRTLAGALTVLPFLVQLVILLVNGNLGAGVAVAGAFSLIRFRSAPGSARDITAIFLAMTVGLCCGIRVTVPENLDYGELFTDLFENFTSAHQLVQVKTVNMGSLFRLQYRVHLKHPEQEKQLLDAMRCRNGNLEISCGIPETSRQGDLL